jgi:hypothetical protein
MRAFIWHPKIVWIPLFFLSTLYLALYCLRYRTYIPVSDDISQLGATLDGSFSQWISEGFRNYAVVYPEWYRPITNLARPVINVIFYSEYLLFARNFPLYFILVYVLQLCGALILVYFLRAASVSTRAIVLFLTLFLINPAFINYGTVLLSFQLDVFASVFLLVAFYALWVGRYLTTVLMLTLAVFTKETLFAPVAAALTVFIWRRPPLLAIGVLLPLIFWLLQRIATFGSLGAGNYSVPNGVRAAAIGLLKGILIWPTGVIPGAGMFSLPHQGYMALAFYAAMLVCNALLWVTLIYSGWLLLRHFLREKSQPLDERFRLLVGVYIWVLGSISFCVLLGLSYVRYGASVYAFLLLFLPIMLFSNVVLFPLRRTSNLIVSLLYIACIGHGIKFFTTDFTDNGVGNQVEHALYDVLRSLPPSSRAVYVINAPGDIGASPKFLEAAWQIAPRVTFINQFAGCPRSSAIEDSGLENITDGAIEVRIPQCASFKFQNADSTILAAGVNGELQRPGVATYRFPQARIEGYWFQEPTVPVLNFGKVMFVKLEQSNAALIAYNWPEGRYQVLEKEK